MHIVLFDSIWQSGLKFNIISNIIGIIIKDILGVKRNKGDFEIINGKSGTLNGKRQRAREYYIKINDYWHFNIIIRISSIIIIYRINYSHLDLIYYMYSSI